MNLIKWLFVFVLPFLVNEQTFAQKQRLQLTPAIKTEIIDSVSSILIKNYVSLDTAIKMSACIKQKLKSGAYDNITDPQEFSEIVTLDVWSVYKDGHFAVAYDPSSPKSTMEVFSSKIRDERQRNYGVLKVEHMDGNIGYLLLSGFEDVTPRSKEVIDGVFSVLKNSDALIIDLRKGGGGQPEMVKYICSYLFKERVTIDANYYRRGNVTKQFWTEPVPNSDAFSSMPVYILTSRFCFSGCEELAYDLQSQHRATIVGEVTGGGAHGTDVASLNYGFKVYIPFLNIINPVTKINWEKIGVQPDIKVDADSALNTAIMDFYKHQPNVIRDSLIALAKFKKALDDARAHPFAINKTSLKAFAGHYQRRTVALENGSLYFFPPAGYKIIMIPLSPTEFIIGNGRVAFNKNMDQMTIYYQNGGFDQYKRDSFKSLPVYRGLLLFQIPGP
ncbi:MAG: Peptidase family [Mucilaginibacter sp.]|nr:Peptidase family [Mucilaginibacter sp.]